MTVPKSKNVAEALTEIFDVQADIQLNACICTASYWYFIIFYGRYSHISFIITAFFFPINFVVSQNIPFFINHNQLPWEQKGRWNLSTGRFEVTRSYAIETEGDEGEAVESERKENAIHNVMLFNDFHLRMTKHQSPVATYLLNNDSLDATKVSFDSAL